MTGSGFGYTTGDTLKRSDFQGVLGTYSLKIRRSMVCLGRHPKMKAPEVLSSEDFNASLMILGTFLKVPAPTSK